MAKKYQPGGCCCTPPLPPECLPNSTWIIGTIQLLCPGRPVPNNPFAWSGVTVTATGTAGQGTFSGVTNVTGLVQIFVSRPGTYTIEVPAAVCPQTFTAFIPACGGSANFGTRILNMGRLRFEITRQCSISVTTTVTLTGPPGAIISGYNDPTTFKTIYCVSHAGTYSWTIPPTDDGNGNICSNGASGSGTPSCSTIPLFTGHITNTTHSYTVKGIGCNNAVVATSSGGTFTTGCQDVPSVTLTADRYDPLFVDNSLRSFSECKDVIETKTMTVASGYTCTCCHKPIKTVYKIQDSLGTHDIGAVPGAGLISGCITATNITVGSAIPGAHCGGFRVIESYPFYYGLQCSGDRWTVFKFGAMCQINLPVIHFCPIGDGFCTGDPVHPVGVPLPSACVVDGGGVKVVAGGEVGTSAPFDLDACPPGSYPVHTNLAGWEEDVTVMVE